MRFTSFQSLMFLLSLASWVQPVSALELPAGATIYASDDRQDRDTQLFTIAGDAGVDMDLGALLPLADLETLALDPAGGTLFAITAESGELWRIDKRSGALEAICTLPNVRKFREIAASSFHPATGELWAYQWNVGLITVDVETCDTALVWRQPRVQGIPRKWDAIAWQPDGAVLYGAQRQDLYAWDAELATATVLCSSLPDKTEGLEYGPQGRLWGASGSRLFVVDPASCVVTELAMAFDRREDIESLAFESTTADTEPPTVAIVAPPAGVFLADPRPQLGVTWSDGGSGVDAASLAFFVDGVALAISCTTESSGATCLPAAPLPDGVIDLSVAIRDLAGNPATASLQLTIDTEGVQVAIDAPASGLVTAASQIEVTGTAAPEVSEVVVNEESASLTDGAFTATVPLREGTQMVVARATKANGNTGTASIEVTRDLEPPIVRITSPRDGLLSPAGRVTVTGVVNDIVSGAVAPVVRVNGVEASVANGSFMVVDLPLTAGTNSFEAIATDAVGNEGRDAVSLTVQPIAGARLQVTAGNGQRASVRETLPEPLVVTVSDDSGQPVAGRIVRFEVVRNSATLRRQAADEPRRFVQMPTDGAGRAAVLLTLGDTAGEGNNRVRVTGQGIFGEVEICASARPAAADKILMVEGDNQRGLVGHPLAAPLESLVVDVDGNPLPGIEVTFEVVQGSGHLDGLSTARRQTGSDGVARAVLTLGMDAGISNNMVRASYPSLTGLPAVFTASGLAAADPAQTRLVGVVLDSGQAPIPAAIVHVVGTGLTTTTDSEGQFLLASVPVGHLTLEIDPTASPRPEIFPPLAFETITVAGQENTLGQPILLPALDLDHAAFVGGDEDVTLTMAGVEGLSLTVFANSTIFPDGSPIGELSISQVHLDKVPMPPPIGTFFMPPAWTVQPAGVRFDPPARITIPNDGLPPGRVIDIFQFDHTLHAFIDVGTGTVSEDGFLITSDPGFGITRSGWGGCGQPPPPTVAVVAANISGRDGDCGPNGPARAPAGAVPGAEWLACWWSKAAYCEYKFGSPCRAGCGQACDLADNPSGFQACLVLCSLEQADCLVSSC